MKLSWPPSWQSLLRVIVIVASISFVIGSLHDFWGGLIALLLLVVAIHLLIKRILRMP